MEPPKDLASGRHIIEGRGIPIDGEVFRRNGQPGIVVDTKKFGNQNWFKAPLDIILAQPKGMLGMATAFARENMPVNVDNYKRLLAQKNVDRYSLAVYATDKDEHGKELGGGQSRCTGSVCSFID